jgi:hypothetical protein
MGRFLLLAIDLVPSAPIARDWASSADGPSLGRVRRLNLRRKDEGRRGLAKVNININVNVTVVVLDLDLVLE